VKFDCAVFTNLQSDHLDFHKDREHYFAAKARLFELLAASPKRDRLAALNADDERTPALLASLKGALRTVTFGIDSPADFRAENLRLGAEETLFTLAAGGSRLPVRLGLLGRHNVYNALAAIAAASLELPPGEAAAGVTALRNVPGRLQRVEAGQDFTVFVDYAHTEAALASVLESLRPLARGKIITVFGCGGDRDATKRAPMGRTACAQSDRVVITSDNPRGEDPVRIMADIERGVAGIYSNYEIVPDRAWAIARAVGLARPGDIVLIAGKGHENYQILADRTVPFSDAAAAAEEIRKLK
jgi:UDP-N-acetylmuramoyl-L-alanyl-D-glutamate--2,6-diaminopimelate ligase